MSTPDGELRDDDRGPPDSSDRRRRVLLVATLGLALVAAVVVVVSDDARWLRLGVVAALWSALIAAYVVARRGGVAGSSGPSDEIEALRREHERDLEREVAARREFELTVERDLRRELEAERGRELTGLRTELERLRTHLDVIQPGDRTVQGRPARLRVVGESPPASPTSPAPPASPPSTPPVPAAGRPAMLPAGPAPAVLGPSYDTDRRGTGRYATDRRGTGRYATDRHDADRRDTGRYAADRRDTGRYAADRHDTGRYDTGHQGVAGAFNGSATGRRDRSPDAPGAVRAPPAPGPHGAVEPALWADGSFVDQYVRSAGYDRADGPPEVDGVAAPAGTDVPEPWRGSAVRVPAAGSSATTGRTVAELLAEHAAGAGPTRRRRRDTGA